MVRLNEQVAEEYHRQPFPLWDFSGFNSYTTEAVPKLGDKVSMMEWFWESSHYRKELGDRVLDRVLDYTDPDRQIADDFGVLLTSGNIEQHLEAIRQSREAYEQAHPEEVKEIQELVRKYRSY